MPEKPFTPAKEAVVAVEFVGSGSHKTRVGYFRRVLSQAEKGLAERGLSPDAWRDARITVVSSSLAGPYEPAVGTLDRGRARRVLGDFQRNRHAWMLAEMAALANAGLDAESPDVEEKLAVIVDIYERPHLSREAPAAGRRKRQQNVEPVREMFRAVCRDYEAKMSKTQERFTARGAITHLRELHRLKKLSKLLPNGMVSYVTQKDDPQKDYLTVKIGKLLHEWKLSTLEKTWVSSYRTK